MFTKLFYLLIYPAFNIVFFTSGSIRDMRRSFIRQVTSIMFICIFNLSSLRVFSDCGRKSQGEHAQNVWFLRNRFYMFLLFYFVYRPKTSRKWEFALLNWPHKFVRVICGEKANCEHKYDRTLRDSSPPGVVEVNYFVVNKTSMQNLYAFI